MRPIKLVFGNHREPVAIVDFMTTLREGLAELGVRADYEPEPVPGCLNVVLEGFSKRFTEKVERLGADAHLVIVATEFITNDTFNDFAFEPRSVQSVVLGRAMSRLDKARRLRAERRGEGERPRQSRWGSHYDKKRLWRKRFRNFLRLARFAEATWCLAPEQVESYRRATGSNRVHCFRFGFVEPQERLTHLPETEKDIDFLFTGSMTPYRRRILEALSHRGHRVLTVGPMTPSPMRADLVGRARVCLNLKQSPEWEHPSVNRFHYHLVRRSLLVTQPTRYDCDLSPYVSTAAGDGELLDSLCEIHRAGDFNERGNAAAENYRKQTSLADRLEQLVRDSLDGWALSP